MTSQKVDPSNTTTCEFCGKTLMMRYVENPFTSGGVVNLGFQECGCAQATAKRLAKQADEAIREQAAAQDALARKLQASGIPKRYLAKGHPDAERLTNNICNGVGFYLDGKQGTGKTTLAMAVARLCVERKLKVRVEIAPNLMEDMRSRKVENRERTHELATCDVLILDDLGKEAPTAYACERLFQVINDRYNEELPIVVTSNYSRGEIASRLTEGDVGKSIASRLVEMTTRVHFDGIDRRLSRG